MSAWAADELRELGPIIDAVIGDLEPPAGMSILVMCSAAGKVAFRIRVSPPTTDELTD